MFGGHMPSRTDESPPRPHRLKTYVEPSLPSPPFGCGLWLFSVCIESSGALTRSHWKNLPTNQVDRAGKCHRGEGLLMMLKLTGDWHATYVKWSHLSRRILRQSKLRLLVCLEAICVRRADESPPRPHRRKTYVEPSLPSPPFGCGLWLFSVCIISSETLTRSHWKNLPMNHVDRARKCHGGERLLIMLVLMSDWHAIYVKWSLPSRRILRQSKLRLLECLEAICLRRTDEVPPRPHNLKTYVESSAPFGCGLWLFGKHCPRTALIEPAYVSRVKLACLCNLHRIEPSE